MVFLFRHMLHYNHYYMNHNNQSNIVLYHTEYHLYIFLQEKYEIYLGQTHLLLYITAYHIYLFSLHLLNVLAIFC